MPLPLYRSQFHSVISSPAVCTSDWLCFSAFRSCCVAFAWLHLYWFGFVDSVVDGQSGNVCVAEHERGVVGCVCVSLFHCRPAKLISIQESHMSRFKWIYSQCLYLWNSLKVSFNAATTGKNYYLYTNWSKVHLLKCHHAFSNSPPPSSLASIHSGFHDDGHLVVKGNWPANSLFAS